MRSILTRGKARLRRTASRMASIARGDGDPLAPGVVLDVDPGVPVITGAPPDHFLWLDRTSAARRIKTELRRGQLTPAEGEILRGWAENGYAVIPQCIDHALVDAALRDIDRMWLERWRVIIDLLTGTCARTTVDRCPPETRHSPHKLNHLDKFSDAVRGLFLHERIVRIISLIFRDEVVGVNSLTFQYGSQQTAHVDHVYMTPSPPRRMVAAWIALEDVQPDSGPLEIWPRSHRLPPFKWNTPYPYHFSPPEQAAHAQYLASQQPRFTPERFLAKKGDVLLWHSMLAHGGTPIENSARTRLSMACHYFSRECFGESVAEIERRNGAWVTKTGVDDPD